MDRHSYSTPPYSENDFCNVLILSQYRQAEYKTQRWNVEQIRLLRMYTSQRQGLQEWVRARGRVNKPNSKNYQPN